MSETQTSQPKLGSERAFQYFANTHPNNQRGPGRHRGAERGPRHERPGERLSFRERVGRARRVGRHALDQMLHGPAVKREMARYDQAERERRAIGARQQQLQIEAAQAEAARQVMDLTFHGDGGIRDSRFRIPRELEAAPSAPATAPNRANGTIYRAHNYEYQPRHAAPEVGNAAPAAEGFNDVITHAETLEPSIPVVAPAESPTDIDLPPVAEPSHGLRETVGADPDLPILHETLNEFAPQESQAPQVVETDAEDLPIFQATKHPLRERPHTPRHAAHAGHR
jgi:hypothetical protein